VNTTWESARSAIEDVLVLLLIRETTRKLILLASLVCDKCAMFKQLPVIEPEEAVKKLREDLDMSIKKGKS
jgi:hypothetical protein